MISVPVTAYLRDVTEDVDIQTQEWPFHENTFSGVQPDESRHWEPISGKPLDIPSRSMANGYKGCLPPLMKDTKILRST